MDQICLFSLFWSGSWWFIQQQPSARELFPQFTPINYPTEHKYWVRAILGIVQCICYVQCKQCLLAFQPYHSYKYNFFMVVWHGSVVVSFLPRGKKVLGSICRCLSMQSLYVLQSMYGFPLGTQSKYMWIRSSSYSKFPVGMNVCQPLACKCDELASCPGCTPPCAQN